MGGNQIGLLPDHLWHKILVAFKMMGPTLAMHYNTAPTTGAKFWELPIYMPQMVCSIRAAIAKPGVTSWDVTSAWSY